MARLEAALCDAQRAAPAPPRRILHVLPSFAVGGIQVRLVQVANALGPAFRHAILPLDGRVECAARVDASVSFEILSVPRGTQGLWLAAHLRRHAALRAAAPDLVVTYNWGAIEWAASARFFAACPHVHFEDGFGPDEADRRHARRNIIRRIVLRHARVVVPSATLRRVARLDWKLPDANILHVPNGIDLARFDQAARATPPAAVRRSQPQEVLVGVATPLRREKNVARLIRATAAMPQSAVRILIAGDGPERPALEATAQRAGIAERVAFLGELHDSAAFLSALDVYALTSDTEQMPLGLLEAMAARLPVAAVDVGDVKSIVSDQNRQYVVPRDDEGAFARALGALAADGATRRSIGCANREHVANAFGWHRLVRDHERILSWQPGS